MDSYASCLRLLHPDSTFEIRVLGVDRITSGYFTDHDAAAQQIEAIERKRPAGVYVTLNPVLPALIARANSRLVGWAKNTTKDDEIVSRRWLVVDIDPKRPSGIAADLPEMRAAERLADQVEYQLRERGWPDPVGVDSGNGRYLLYRLDLPNDQESRALITDFYRALKAMAGPPTSEPHAEIDLTCSNAARIIRVGGSWNRKGDHTDERPHRRCIFLDHEEPRPVTADQIKDFCREFPAVARTSPTPRLDTPPRLDVGKWLRERGVAYAEKIVGDSVHFLITCPFDASHGENKETAVVQRNDGLLTFSCKHNSCSHRKFADAKAAIGLPTDDCYDLPPLSPVNLRFTGPTTQSPAPAEEPESPPLHLLAVPGFIGEVVRYDLATAKRVQPMLALAGAIALQAVLVSRKVVDEFGTRPNLQIVSLAPSGLGKDFARQVQGWILTNAGADDLLGDDDITSDSAIMSMLDEHPSRLIRLDEIGKFLRAVNGAKNAPWLASIVTALMKLYSSAGNPTYKPKAYARRKDAITLHFPHVVLYGTSTPETFFGGLTAEQLTDGFLSRCLVVAGDMEPARQMTPELAPPESIVATARKWFQFAPGNGDLASVNPTAMTIATDSAASELFERLAIEADNEKDSTVRGMAVRNEQKARQLALVYACSAAPAAPVIDQAAAAWACELVRWSHGLLVRAAEKWVASNQTEAYSQRLLREIAKGNEGRPGRISKTTLARKTQWLKSRERDEFLNSLESAGLVTQEMDTETGGRTAFYWCAVKN